MLREIFGSYVLKDSSVIGTVTLNSKGEILTANAKFASMVGIDEPKLIKHSVSEILPQLKLSATTATTYEGTWKGISKFGRELDLIFSFNNACLKNDQQDCCLFVLERQATPVVLPEKISFLMQSKSLALVLVGPDERIMAINAKASTLLNTTTDLAIDKKFSEINFIIPELNNADTVQQLGKSEHAEHLEGKLYTEHENKYFEVSIDQIAEANTTFWLYALRDISTTKKTQSSWRNSEKRFSRLFDSASDGIFINDKEGYFIDVNTAGSELCGYSKTEIIGKNIRDFVDNFDVSEGGWYDDKKDATEQPLQYRHVRRKDGRKTLIEVSVTEVDGIYQSIIRDVSRQKESEEIIKKRERLLSEMGRIAKVGGWEYNVLSEELTLEAGFSISDHIGGSHSIPMREWETYFSPEGAKLFHKYLEDSLKTNDAFSFDLELSNLGAPGKWLRIIGHPIVEDGVLSVIQGTVQDITEQKATRKALLREKELSDSLVDSLPGIFYLFNAEGKYLRWNEDLCKVTGYSNEEIKKLHPLNLFSEEEGPIVADRIANVFINGEDSVEANFLTKEGKSIPYYFTGKAVEYNGEMCLMGVGIDISKRKHFENLLEESNKQLNTAQSIAKLGYWEWSEADNSVHWSTEMYEICGMDVQSGPLDAQTFLEGVLPKFRNQVIETCKQVTDTLKPASVEFTFRSQDGMKKQLQAEVMPQIDAQNKIKLEGTLQDITESKEREIKLEESQQRFHLIAQATNDALFEWNPILKNAWWSESLYQMFGFDPEMGEPSFEKWLSKIHPADQNQVLRSVDYIIKGKMQEWSCELRLPLKNGENKTLLLRCFVAHDKDRFKIMGAFIDITNQKANEEVIRLSNERYELIGKATNDAIWDVDRSTGIITGNEQLYRLYDHDPATPLTTEKFFERLHPEDLEPIMKNEADAIRYQKESISNEYRFKVGDEYRIILDRVYILYNEDRTVARMVGAMQDITQKKEAEMELQELSNRLLLATTSANLGIFDWDVDEDKLVWNEYMYDMFQLDPIEFDHTFNGWLACLHPKDVREFNQCSLLENEQKHHYQHVVRTIDENEDIRYIETHAVIIKDENEVTKSVIGICKDVTEAMTSEQKIAKAIIQTQEEERMETGRELHDNIVQLLVASLINLNHAYGKLNGEAGLLDRALEYINQAIGDTRKLSHQLAPSNLNEASLDENICKLLEDINADGKYEIVVQKDVEDALVVPHEIKLNVYRIVQEQINNILKHAKATKIIQSITITSTMVEVSTSDNGTGFNLGEVTRGIGLNNIDRRVKIFDGELDVVTAPNEGCTMTVRIPIG